jgi:hypothetical protein
MCRFRRAGKAQECTIETQQGDEMHITKRRGLAMLVVAAFAGSATTALSASAHHGNNDRHHGNRHHPVQIFHRAVPVLATSLAPSVPSDPKIHGVAPGTVPWQLKFGAATLLSNGRILVAVKGLLITGTNTTNDNTVGPVQAVDAALYCGDSTTAAATTKSAPLSPKGNALINDKITLPAKCLAPALVINPTIGGAAVPGFYIGASGFGM